MKQSGNWKWGLTLAVTIAAGTACETGLGPDSNGLEAEDAAQLAVTTDELSGIIVLGLMGGGPTFGLSANSAEPREFERQRECPAGGTVSIKGTHDRVAHGEGAVEVTVKGTGEWDDCTHTRTRNDVTITTKIDGTFVFESNRKHNRGQPIGIQTTSKSGAFHWVRTRGDETKEGDCTYSIQSMRNPESGMIKITGEICGRTIDKEVTWKRGT